MDIAKKKCPKALLSYKVQSMGVSPWETRI